MSGSRRPAPDRDVRELLVSDFARSFVVEAGAGSGKTHSLAARMAAGIEHGAYDVEGMAAVTFTRKAAAELRGRFQQALEERLREAKGDVERNRLQAALDGIERLFAGTIHAFCAHLLRERPVDAQVAPGFEELDDVENLRRRRRAWRDFTAEARAGGMQAMLDLLDADVRPKDLDGAFATVCEHEDVEFDRGDGNPPDPAPTWKHVDRFWRDLRGLRPPAFPDGTTCVVQQRFDEFDRRLAVADRGRLSSLAGFLKAWGKQAPVQYQWGDHGPAVKARVDRFQVEVVEPFLEAWRAYVHRLAMTVLLAARDYYAQARRRQNVVNYVDLLRVTSRMLRDCPHVRRALQAKYRWLFIDEFQDTDPIQAEIFLMLAADERRGAERRGAESRGAAPGADAFTLPLRSGALFVVGDPKQSIFRFRRADIDIYNRVAQRIEATGGRRLGLVANFRSLPGVCDLANAVFPPLFGQFTLPWSPAYTPLSPVREAQQGRAAPAGHAHAGQGPVPRALQGSTDARPCIAKLTVAASRADEAVREEARAIAAYVRSEVAAGRRRHGDFLVLTRFRTRLSEYTSAFDALEIPVDVSGAGFFCKSPEVRELGLLLAALADPLDSVCLVGVLRGALFGISDPELFAFRQAGGRFELHAPLPPGVPAIVESAMRRLQAMLRLTWELPLGAAVDRILEETGWLALASTRPAGAAAGRLLQAVDRVRQVVEDGGGLADAADALDEEESSNDAEALPLEPGRLDVVRLMNLHKAKGLEAPVVILADSGRDYEFPITARVVRGGECAAGYLRIANRREGKGGGLNLVAQPRDWNAHDQAEKRYVEAERLRLLYVASTRAKDQLVVCRAPAVKGAKKVWRDFEPFLAGVPELEIPSPSGSVATLSPGDGGRQANDERQQDRAAAAAARDASQSGLRAASWSVARVTGPHAGNRPHDAAPVAPGPAPGARANDEGPGGVLWGSLVHGLLEHAVRHQQASRADLVRLARWLTVDTPELRAFVPSAVDLVEDLRRAPFWSDVTEAREAHVEVPFAIRLEPGESLGTEPPVAVPTLVRGVIDVLLDGTGVTPVPGWTILDYKTDRLAGFSAGTEASDAWLIERHGPQLTQYQAAWERATGTPVTRAGIVSVRARRTIWIGGSQPT
jgi:ATP-dependent helicase/nuclease subunit A